MASHQYLEPGTFKYIYLYQHRTQAKQIWGLFIPGLRRATIFVVDTVRSNQLPNMPTLFNTERSAFLNKPDRTAAVVPEADHTFEVAAETDVRRVHRQIGRLLAAYQQEKRGPTIVAIQTQAGGPAQLAALIPQLADMPVIPIHVTDADSLFAVLDWQRVGAKVMIRHYLKSDLYLASTIEHCRYFHVPAGNLPRDTTIFGADLFFARHLRKQNFVLWASTAAVPDFGGKEADDSRLQSLQDDTLGCVVSHEGLYRQLSAELDIDALAVNTLLQSQAIQELDGTAGAVAFDAAPQLNLEDMLLAGPGGGGGGLASYDETALAAPAFRVLRIMVATWLRDVSQYQNVFADYQERGHLSFQRSKCTVIHGHW